jgi:hypothetical protein
MASLMSGSWSSLLRKIVGVKPEHAALPLPNEIIFRNFFRVMVM